MSDREFLTEPFEDEDEERTAVEYVHPAVRSYMYSPMGDDSDSPDDTVKCSGWKNQPLPPQQSDSSESKTSTSEDDSEGQVYLTRECVSEYTTLTPNKRDNSTRCDGDFKWLLSGEIMDDTVEIQSVDSRGDNNSASFERNRRTPSDRSERDRKTRSSLSTKPPHHPSSFRVAPKPRPSQNEVAQTDLQRRWNSYEHFRCPEGSWCPPMCWCHGPPPQSMLCMHPDHSWPSHPSLPGISSSPNKVDAETRGELLKKNNELLMTHNKLLYEQNEMQKKKISDLEQLLKEMQIKLDDTNMKLMQETSRRVEGEMENYHMKKELSNEICQTMERTKFEQEKAKRLASAVLRPSPPKTPPANFGRVIDRNAPVYASLPRSAHLPFTSAEPRVQLVEQREVVDWSRQSPTPSLRQFQATIPRSEKKFEADNVSHLSVAYAEHRRSLQMAWQRTDVREWDCEMTCNWLAHLSLEMYIPAARTWLGANPDGKGMIANALPITIEKELAIKHPMHRKKIVLAVSDLLGDHGDALLSAAGSLDTHWVLRWLEDVGVSEVRASAAEASLDGRLLHRLTHTELYTHLRVTHALHALSIRRGIQVLRDNKFNPETMIRRATEEPPAGVVASTSQLTLADMMAVEPVAKEMLSRWSSHRVMQWLNEIDLTEFAPNLRGSGVHGGLMILEPRFNSDLLAALLNITCEKSLLRRHLAQKFHDLLGREEIQKKRDAEKTLGYQPLTPTTKYKMPTRKSPFTLRRKKNRDCKNEMNLTDLVCPFFDTDFEGEPQTTTNESASPIKAVCPRDVTPGH